MIRHLLKGNFTKIAENMDFSVIINEVNNNLDLFDRNDFRQKFKGSPFKNTSFIPCRMSYDLDYEPTEEELIEHLKTKGITNIYASDTEEYALLPKVYSAVMDLAALVKAEQIGRVLVTRLNPGGHIKPHKDFGAYHDYYDRFHIVLDGKGCHFRSGEQIVKMMPGEVWWFYNNDEHEVWNDSDVARIHIVIDFKLKGDKV